MNIGDRIREKRIAMGMTMEDLGNAIGVQRSAINKYEKGMVELKASQVRDIAKVLNVSACYLLDGTANGSNEEERLIAAYRGASPEIRSAALTMLEDSANARKKENTAQKAI